MKYRLQHTSTYEYEAPVFHARHLVRKRPRSLPGQLVSSTHIVSSPNSSFTREFLDYYGNHVTLLEMLGAHESLEVTSISEVSLFRSPLNSAREELHHPWESRVSEFSSHFQVETQEMTMSSPLIPPLLALREFALLSFTPGRSLFEGALELSSRIFDEFTYDPQFTDIATPLSQVLEKKRGVCQDFAHIFVGALRSLGLPARYVSGYIETQPPPGQARLVGADASHAWASLCFGNGEWIDFDPTNNIIPCNHHITVAWGRDFSEVTPLKGVVHGGGRHGVHVAVDMAPLEPPLRQAQLQSQNQSFGLKS